MPDSLCYTVIRNALVLLQFRIPMSSSLAASITQNLTIRVTRTTVRFHLFLKLHCQHLIPKLVRFMSIMWETVSSAWICSLIFFLSKGKDWGRKINFALFCWQVLRLLRFGQADFPLCGKFFTPLLRTVICWFLPEEAVVTLLPKSSCSPLPFLRLLLLVFCHHLGTVANVYLAFDLRRPSSLKLCHRSFSKNSHISLWIHWYVLEAVSGRFGVLLSHPVSVFSPLTLTLVLEW